MNEGGTATRSTWRLAGLLLVLVAALGAQAEPPSSKLPGRQPDSTAAERKGGVHAPEGAKCLALRSIRTLW